MTLPPMLKGVSKTTKNQLNEGKKFDYRLPSNYKFTSDESYTNVDLVRDKLRRNFIDHKNFEPMYEAEEGQKYYGKVYQPNKDVYVSVKDPGRKNKILKIQKPNAFVDPNEIDPMRDPLVAASRYVDAEGTKHIDLSLANRPKIKHKKVLTKKDEEDRERDLLAFIFNYENFV